MDSTSSRPEKNQRVSHFTIAAILALALGVVLSAYFIGGPKKVTELAKPAIDLASTEEIDAWLKSELKSTNAPFAILNVWATWCEPCRTEMPELAEFQKLYPEWPLLLVSADNEKDIETARSFLQKSKVEKPSRLLRGEQSAFIEDWQKRSSADPARQWSMSLPVTFFVDQDGKVLKFLAAETTRQELAAIANSLTKPKRPDAL